MFKQKGAEARKAQAHLAAAIMEPQFQEVFNLNKGSIPVRMGMDLSKFDQCAKDSAAEFAAVAKSDRLVPSWAHEMAMPSANKGAMFDLVTSFMNTPAMTPRQAAERMTAAGKNFMRSLTAGAVKG